jgi:hypothetical protein
MPRDLRPSSASSGGRYPAAGPVGAQPIFDAHLHIIDPRFPLVANQGYTPEPFDVAAYHRRTAALPVTGGAVVSGSFQDLDQSYLLDALRRLGPNFVGVTQLPPTATDDQIRSLSAAGVRGLRCNLHRGGGQDLDEFAALAARGAALAGWHVELYVDARDLHDLAGWLPRLPAFSVDHLGLSAKGLPALLQLVERGAAVKASGFSRGDLDVPAAWRRSPPPIRRPCCSAPTCRPLERPAPSPTATSPWCSTCWARGWGAWRCTTTPSRSIAWTRLAADAASPPSGWSVQRQPCLEHVCCVQHARYVEG